METKQASGADNSLIRERLYTFNDAWTEWLAGNKFPVAFFGDSTFDGANTTEWVRNTLGTDNLSPNAFSNVLERLLRQATNNPALRIYNAGFSGQVARWAVTVLDQEFGEASAYNDVKMIGIGFGINDRLGFPNEKAYRDSFKASVKQMIEWCYSGGIQPFLLTTQATVEPGVLTQYAETYPMRTSEHIYSVANEVKRELADQYGLQLIDLNKFTEMFLLYSSVPARTIISDRLHFGNIGHKAEAEYIFSRFSPRTIVVDGYAKIDYSSQQVFDCVPEDWLTMPESPTDCFKVYVDYAKADAADIGIMSAWVFVSSKKKLTLKAYKSESAGTYVRVNGVRKALTGPETVLEQIDIGLYKLEVFTGESARADFKGFILE
ncbi:SGNH/GDSL hydrolase family protein [Paenibacillus mesophilus]|uniref:SGNH/GDSL hydrolase family protein n=1 Tax=Paenibacillus mesophilus TaxID=2582849 RepID=UPI00110DA834|nr:SGNH/GDSL hydrolase family protein [Paenibacillus mesophilus]TMV43728.1 SGNH/GDSL hydrolase family protein [Paenibacillus mesophilus]